MEASSVSAYEDTLRRLSNAVDEISRERAMKKVMDIMLLRTAKPQICVNFLDVPLLPSMAPELGTWFVWVLVYTARLLTLFEKGFLTISRNTHTGRDLPGNLGELFQV